MWHFTLNQENEINVDSFKMMKNLQKIDWKAYLSLFNHGY